jgi:hypothetical protein
MVSMRAAAFVAVLAAIIGLGIYAFLGGEPERDIVAAAYAGDLAKVKRLLERDPALIRVKVYPQAYERASQRRDYEARYGRSLGRAIPDPRCGGSRRERGATAGHAGGGGGRLGVRRNGRTLSTGGPTRQHRSRCLADQPQRRCERRERLR